MCSKCQVIKLLTYVQEIDILNVKELICLHEQGGDMMESMKNDFTQNDQKDIRNIYKEIFDTDDVNKLREIALKAQKYDQLFQNRRPVNARGAGRRSLFTEEDIAGMARMYQDNCSMLDIAQHFNTSRQTVYKYLLPGRRFETDRFVTMRMKYMHENTLCTTIDVDFMNKKIYVTNHSNDIIHLAFGVAKNPTWEDFELFLESRCVPKTRANIKNVLRDIGVSNYDPIQIIEKTKGRMAEDNQWIEIIYKTRRNGNDGIH